MIRGGVAGSVSGSVRASLSQRGSGGGASLRDQVLALSPTVMFDPSKAGTVFQDRSATPSTPAANGDVVGTMLDISGNANHAIAPSDAARPILRQGGGLSWLEFDGVDDRLVLQSATSLVDVYVAARFGSATQVLFGTTDAGNREYFLYDAPSTTLYVYDGDATPNTYAVVNITNADVVLGGRMSASAFLRVNGVALSSGGDESGGTVSATYEIGARSTGNAPLLGRCYGLVGFSTPLSAPSIAVVENWLASTQGRAL